MSVWKKQVGGKHYIKYKIQPSRFVVENKLLYPEGCVIKYILRHRLKGKKQDLEKAIHFIEMIIERDYPTTVSISKDFLEEAEKEKKELEESYKESQRQTKERKNFHPRAIDGYSE